MGGIVLSLQKFPACLFACHLVGDRRIGYITGTLLRREICIFAYSLCNGECKCEVHECRLVFFGSDYMPLISRKKYCTKIAKITQFWCNIGFASCRMPKIRTEGRQCQLRQHRNQSVREQVPVMVETFRRLLEWQIQELRKLEPGLPGLQAAQFSRHVHLCTSAP